MKNCIRAILFLVLIPFASIAQSDSAMTWFGQGGPFVKVTVTKDQVYAIPGAMLIARQPGYSGRSFQSLGVYNLGKAIAVEVNSSDGVLSAEDTIYFIGEKYRGQLDDFYYRTPAHRRMAGQAVLTSENAYFIGFDGVVSPRIRTLISDTSTRSEINNYFHTQDYSYRDFYAPGIGFYRTTKVHHSFMEDGEGWHAGPNTNVQAKLLSPATPINNPRNVPLTLEYLVYGLTDFQHPFEVSVGGLLQETKTFTGMRAFTSTMQVPQSAVGVTGANLNLKVLGIASGVNQTGLAFARLTYPINTNLLERGAGFALLRENDQLGYSRFSLDSGLGRVYLVNSQQVMRVLPNASGLFAIEGRTAFVSRRVAAVFDSMCAGVTISKPSISQVDYLMVTHSNFSAGNARYKAYRQGAAGGSHTVAELDVNDAYNLFTYGIHSPLAIRKAVDYFRASNLLEHVLLIGKGFSTLNYWIGANHRVNFIPTFGSPPSDVYYVAGFNGLGNRRNRVTIGRLPVSTEEDLDAYLNKLITYESPTNDGIWRKRVLHLSGGKDERETTRFKSYMLKYARVLEDGIVKGKAYAYSKQSQSIVEGVKINQYINNGLSLINLFGHSANTTTDIDIGSPEDPNQEFAFNGRYPGILVNGCYAGNVFVPTQRGFAETWVLTPDVGAIFLIGSMDEGLPPMLDRMTTHLYENQYNDRSTMHLGIGNVMAAAGKDYINELRGIDSTGYVTSYDSILLEQTVLIGDPALKLFGRNRPDYAVDQQKPLSEGNLSQMIGNVAITYRLLNLGTPDGGDSVKCIVKHVAPTGAITFIGPKVIKPFSQDDTISFNLDGFETYEGGNHSFELMVDYLNNINEENEINNIRVDTVRLSTERLRVLYPRNYAIVGTSLVNAAFQGKNGVTQTVQIEIDTVENFTSTARRIFTGSGRELIRARIQLPFLKDSLVYYMRTRIRGASNDTGTITQSFTYIGNSSGGWAQRSFEQQKFASLSGLTRVFDIKAYRYKDDSTIVDIQTTGDSLPLSYNTHFIKVNGVPITYGTQSFCSINNTVLAMYLKPCTMRPYLYYYGGRPRDLYFYYSCGRTPASVNFFEDVEVLKFGARGGSEVTWAIQSMQPGDNIIMMSQGTLSYPRWHPDIFTIMTVTGANGDSLRALKPGQPFIHVGTRYFNLNPNAHITVLANKTDTIDDRRETISYRSKYSTCKGVGSMESELVGPVIKWKTVTWDFARDSGIAVSLTLMGYRSPADTGTILVSGITNRQLDISNISATEYPFLKIINHLGGDSSAKAPQLKQWLVTYDEAPEAVALAINQGEDKILVEGQKFSIAGQFENVTPIAFTDSLTTRLQVYDGAVLTQTFSVKSSGLKGDSLYRFVMDSISTIGFPNRARLRLQFNANRSPERFYTNNEVEFYVTVLKDSLNPIAKVIVNNRSIEYGSYVDNDPVIEFMVEDENPILKATLNNIKITFGQACDTCQLPEIDKRSLIVWSEGSKQHFSFKPGVLAPGTYAVKLLATDFKGNISGRNLCETAFKIADSKFLRNFQVYPNPAITSASVLFELSDKNALEGRDVECLITDWTGRTVRKVKIFNDKIFTGANIAESALALQSADGAPLRPGVYMLTVDVGGKVPVYDKSGKATNVIRLVVQ